MAERDFQLYTPISFFEKADAPEGERRRFAGLITTETVDQEDEVVVQKGLDFTGFMKNGWFNDNHSKKQVDVLGFPLDVKYVKKGEVLPDGRISPADGHWAEGALVEGYGPAEQVWNLGQALQKTERRKLGFSIEGKILRRSGPAGKHIARANVSNVAITHCPVNTDTYFVTLAKALREEEKEIDEDEKKEKDKESEEKAFTVGGAAPGVGVGGRKPVGPVTGTGAGAVMARESLESEATKILKARLGRDPETGLVAKLIEVTRELKRAHVI